MVGFLVCEFVGCSSLSKMGGWPAAYCGEERLVLFIGLVWLVVVSGLVLLSAMPGNVYKSASGECKMVLVCRWKQL